jgi:putative hydrolase of the HAD superfamily
MPTSQKIEGLLFDMGGVVFEIDFERALQTWSNLTRLPIEEIRSRVSMDQAYEKHERGEIKASEYFSHLRHVLELEANDSEIAVGWNAIYLEEIAETVNYVLAVNNDMPCFAFTNSNPTHQAFWETAYPRAIESFHQIFVSSDLGLRKPERAAFETISNATGIKLNAMLFFDDTEENVNGARAVGMEAVHVKTHLDVQQALAEIGAL